MYGKAAIEFPRRIVCLSAETAEKILSTFQTTRKER